MTKLIWTLDGPAGVRPATGKTQFPAGVTTAATWDRNLTYQRAISMGQEFYDLGIHVALAPVTGGPLGRSPYEGSLCAHFVHNNGDLMLAIPGRNWEGFAADPYLTGEAAYQSVLGLQASGVSACAKHFIAYEAETFRNVYGSTASWSVFPANQQLPISANVDDKTIHELYLWPFAEAVRAGVGCVQLSFRQYIWPILNLRQLRNVFIQCHQRNSLVCKFHYQQRHPQDRIEFSGAHHFRLGW